MIPFPLALFSVAPSLHLFHASSIALAQNLKTVGDACTFDADCGTTGGDPDEQIACGVDSLCGAKGAYCSYNGSFGGYSKACVSRMFSYQLQRSRREIFS